MGYLCFTGNSFPNLTANMAVEKVLKDVEEEIIEELRQLFIYFRQNNESYHIMIAIQKCLELGLVNTMTTVLLDPENKDVLEFVGWELIGLFAQQEDFHAANYEYRGLLEAIAENCSPKEVCLGIVEQMDSTLTSDAFLTLLPPLRKVFQRIKGKKSKFFKMAFPQILRHITMIYSLDLEETNSCMEVEKVNNKTALSSALDTVLTLMEYLVHDTKIGERKPDRWDAFERKAQNWELTKCLIGMLETLAFENLRMKKIIKSLDSKNQETDELTSTKSYWDPAQKTLKLLQDLHSSNLYLLMEYSMNSKCYTKKYKPALKSNACADEKVNGNNDEDTDSDVLSLLGLSCFGYLVFVENMADIPQVFSTTYLLKVNLVCTACLLERTENQVIYKGLELLHSLIQLIGDETVEHNILTSPGLLDIFKALVNIMVYCTSKFLRQRATNIFRLLIPKLDSRGRYMISRYLLLDCTHSGVAALLIHNIKEEVHKTLNSQHSDMWFRDKQLISLLLQVCKLPPGMGKERDLIPETERVLGALNCLRYILLSDNDDKTTLWMKFSMFEQGFLLHLREALKVTRFKYQSMQNYNKDEKLRSDQKKKQKEDIDFQVTTPDGTPIDEMSLEDQNQVLQSGLYALEMIECILAHITEIVNSKT